MAQLPSSDRINQYTATASQTTFVYDFKIYDDDEITVQQNDDTLTLTTDYTVTDAGEDDGGTVVLVTGASEDDVITITGNTMVERDTTFSQGGEFNASAINGEFNRIDDILSEIVSDATLNFKLAVYSETVSAVIPNPEATKALVWNADGTALENSTYDPDAAQVASAASASDASDYADAAAASASDASDYADDASDYADAAASSASDASDYADAAAASAAEIDLDALGSSIVPETDSDVDLGSTSKRFADLYVDDVTVTTDVTVGGDIDVTGDVTAATFNGAAVQKAITFSRVQDIKSQGTDGGTYTSGDWRTRDLTNITIAGITGLTLASNQVELPAGTYIFHAIVPAYDVDGHWARLYNVTAAAAIAGSITGEGGGSGNIASVHVICSATFAVTTKIEVQGWPKSTQTSNGMGPNMNIAGMSEYYTSLNIWRMA